MRDNPDDFSPFIEGKIRRLHSLPSLLAVITCDIRAMLLGDWDGYCAKMTKDSTWGGNLELAAVARRYKTHITIHQLGAPRLEVMCHGQSGCPTIHLSYHMGEHYSSVRSEKESAAFVGTSIDLDARLRKAGVKTRSPDEPREEPQSKNEKIVMVYINRHSIPCPYIIIAQGTISNDMLNACIGYNPM
jgi:hypothetical protein